MFLAFETETRYTLRLSHNQRFFMHKNCRLLSALAALFFCFPEAIAEHAVKPFAANYRAYYFGAEITASRELKKSDNNTMELSFRTRSLFIDIDEISTLIWQPNAHSSLIPLDYRYHRTGIGKNRHTQLTFDWQARQVIDLQTQNQIPIPANTVVFDKLSYQLQLQYDLINGKTEFDYLIVDDDKLKNYRFRIAGEESLVTKLGELNTVKLARVRDNNKRATYIWFAKDWHYLLVQFEQREKDNKKYRIQLLNATVDGVDVVGR